jgi:glycosyltransferase involved in cell wall biosynthesis
MYLGSSQHMMTPTPFDNPKGYWEHLRIIGLNDDILALMGGAWDTPPTFDQNWTDHPDVSLIALRLQNFVDAEFADQLQWGWKDPRISLTLAFWKQQFPDARWLVCLRHPVAVAHSMNTGKSMRDFDLLSALKLWQTYNEMILREIAPAQLLITHYESYFYDPEAELKRVLSGLAMPIDATHVEQALATIQPDLRHFSVPDDLINADFVSSTTREYYQLLCQHAGEIYHAAQADDAYQRRIALAYSQYLQRTYMQDRLAPAQSAPAQSNESVQALQTQLAELRADLRESQSRLTDSIAHATNLAEQLAHSQTYARDLQKHLTEKKQDVQNLTRQLERQQATIDELQLQNSAHQTLQALVQEKQTEIDALAQQLTTEQAEYNAQVATLREEVARLQSELADERAEMDARASNLREQLATKQSTHDAQVNTLQETITHLQDDIADLRDSLASARAQHETQLADLQDERQTLTAKLETIERDHSTQRAELYDLRTDLMQATQALDIQHADTIIWKTLVTQLHAELQASESRYQAREHAVRVRNQQIASYQQQIYTLKQQQAVSVDDDVAIIRGQYQHAQHRIEQLETRIRQLQHQLQYVQRDFALINNAWIVRMIAHPIWRFRRSLAPEGSRRYETYQRWKGRVAALLRVNTPQAAALPAPSAVAKPPQTADPKPSQTIVCTIISKNYLAYARTLMASVQSHHGDDIRCVVLLVDEIDGCFETDAEMFDVCLARDLDIPQWQHFSMKYNILELNTAVKPYFLQHLFEHYAADQIIYFDPDIQIFHPLTDMMRLLRTNTVVLTPHLLTSLPTDGKKPDNLTIRQSGIYNLGFFAISRRAPYREILQWWQERLYTQCVVDLEAGIFVDQSWMDLLPTIFDSVFISREASYNVAYWNLHERHVEQRQQTYVVNQLPLVFMHYSGFDPEHPQRVSKHQNRFHMRDLALALRNLFRKYRQNLLAQGYQTTHQWTYAYANFADGVAIPDVMRQLLLDEDPRGERWPNPYAIAQADAFRAWAITPVYPAEQPVLSRLAVRFWQSRSDLQLTFPDIRGADAWAFAQWFVASPEVTERIADALIAPIRDRLYGGEPALVAPPAGVNIIGYAKSETGVGQQARNMLGALRAVDVPTALLPVETNDRARKLATLPDDIPLEARYNVNVIHANADMTPVIRESIPVDALTNRYNIGFWSWELATFPAQWYPALDFYDEIWVPSTFIEQAIAPITATPITTVPIAIQPPTPAPIARSRYGIADDAFVVLFVFDAHSFYERKNPQAVIEAFKRAFTTHERQHQARLMMKVNNISASPAHEQALRSAMRDVNGILIDDYLHYSDVNGLFVLCDAYISLHRAEGFGLTLAEAMYFETPVITTGYSGNMDFTNHDNSFIVPYSLIELEETYGPYAVGNVWAEPDVRVAADHLRQIYENRDGAREVAERAGQIIQSKHSPMVVGEYLQKLLRNRGLL